MRRHSSSCTRTKNRPTWRASEELVQRVRLAAAQRGTSLNEYLTSLARAATDPNLADGDLAQLRGPCHMCTPRPWVQQHR